MLGDVRQLVEGEKQVVMATLTGPGRDAAPRFHVDREVRRIARELGDDQQRVAGFPGSADFPVTLR